MKKRTILANCLAVALISGWPAHRLYAAADTWAAAVSGNWETGARWTDGNTPIATDTATIAQLGSYNVTFGVAPTAIQNLTVSPGAANTVTFQSANVGGAPFTLNVNAAAGSQNLAVTTGTLNLGGAGTNGALNVVTGNQLQMTGGASLNVRFGSTLTLGGGAAVGLTNATAATVTVDGAGSSLTSTLSYQIGTGGTTGVTNVQATGSAVFNGQLVLGTGGANSSGTLNVLTAGTVTMNNTLSVGTSATSGHVGIINVNGASSAMTVSTSNIINVGAASLSTGAINIGTTTAGATFTTGTGTITVNPTGTITVGSGLNTGTFNANGNVVINGGNFNRSSGSTFTLASGKTFTIQAGGDAGFTGTYITTGGTHTVTGAGSQLLASTVLVRNNVTLNIQSGGSSSISVGGIGIGDASSPGTVVVDGVGSTLTATASGSSIGGTAGTSSLTMTNSGQATFGALTLGNGSTAGSIGNVSVVSGADITALGSLSLSAANNSAGSSNLFAVSDLGTTVTQTGASTLTVGAAATPTGAVNATLTVASSGIFNTGTGTTTVNGRGRIEINGGTLNANGNIVINGGLLERLSTAGSNFNWAAAKTMTVQNGGTFTHAAQYATPANSIINVTGTGSSFNVTSTGLVVADDAQITASSGGDLVLAGLSIGFVSTGEMTVDGSGSTLTVSGGAPSIGSSSGTGTLTVRNGASANINGLSVASNFTPDTTGTLLVENGGLVTITNGLSVAAIGSATTSGTVIVDDSNLTVSSGSFILGENTNGTAVLTVKNEGVFSAPATTINPTGELTIDFATVDLGTLNYNNGTVNFFGGSLTYIGDLTIGLGGLLGNTSFTIDTDKALTLSGTTTINAFQSLWVDGGTLSTGALVVNGNFQLFNGGTLIITGGGGFTIGAGGALGLNPTLTSNATLNVVNTLTVNAGSTTTLAGGHIIAGALVNNGSIVLDSGSITAGALTNNAGAFAFVGQNKTATFNGASTNAGEIQFGGGAATLAGTGTLTNTGLIRGDGRATKPLTNSTNGEIRAESGKRVLLTAANGTNAGKINLQGGTAEFSQPLTNGANGLITGRGTLMTGGTGLNNLGNVALSSGITDVFGDVVNNTGVGTKGVQISGNADVTFWDDVTNTSGLFRVSAGSSAAFFGTYAGGGITGTGNVYFEGDVTPGFSPANVTIQPNTFFGPGSKLVMELDGLTLGTQYDHLNFQGTTALAGTLEVISSFVLNSGNSFDLFDGTLSGTFDTLNLPVLGGGLIWNTSNLYTTGTIFVAAPGPNSWQGASNALWSATSSWTSGIVPSNNTDTALFANAVGAGSPIVLDTNQTINKLSFDSTGSYTINPAASQVLSLAGVSPTITTEVGNTGSQTVAVALNLGNNTTINANAGTLNLNAPSNSVLGSNVTATVATGATLNLGGAGNALSNGTTTHANVVNNGTLAATTAGKRVGNITGTGTTNVTAASATLTATSIRQSVLSIGATSQATLTPSLGNKPAGISVFTNIAGTSLSIAAGGNFDTNDNDLIVYYQTGLGAVTLATIQQQIIDGFLGTPAVAKISSSTGAVDMDKFLVAFDNSGIGLTSWEGVTLTGTDQIIAKYTLFGDLNLDGTVDSFDYSVIDSNFGTGNSWLTGDSNLDGMVDSFDYSTVDTHFGKSFPMMGGGAGAGLSIAAIPEPSTFVLGGLAVLGLAGYRLRRRDLKTGACE